MTLKITDQEILDYLWDETLQKIARSTFIRYIGNQLGTYSEERAAGQYEYFAYLLTSEMAIGSLLSDNQFRMRINRLIEQGKLIRQFERSFIINSPYLKEVVIDAVRCWQSVGLPFEQTERGFSTVPADYIDVFNLSVACYKILRQKLPAFE